MKKVILFLLIALCCISMFACGSEEKNSETESVSETESETEYTEPSDNGSSVFADANKDAPHIVFADSLQYKSSCTYDSGAEIKKSADRTALSVKDSVIYLDIEDGAAAAFDNNALFNICFSFYTRNGATIEVEYKNKSGGFSSARADVSLCGVWGCTVVQLDSPTFGNELDGHDFRVKISGKTAYISKIEFMAGNENVSDKLTVIKSKYVDEYISSNVNVLFYGAKGDGVTDDTDAIRSAVNYCSSIGGGTVFIPEGKYVLTDTIDLPNAVNIVGELKKGTTDGTVLLIKHGEGRSANLRAAAFTLGYQSTMKNVCIYYPDQKYENGSFKEYAPTIVQKSIESITLNNIYFVNSYIAIDCARDHDNISLQHIYDIYGCALNTFYWNNASYDIGRVENVHIGPEYWLNSGFPAPNADDLNKYCMENATGLILQRIDWTYISDIYINGIHTGILAKKSSTGTANGHLYNLDFKNVYYGLEAQNISWFLMTNCKIEVSGAEGSVPLYMGKENVGPVSCNSCKFSGGKHVVENNGKGSVIFSGCELSAKEKVLVGYEMYSFINTTTGSDTTDYGNLTVQDEKFDFDSVNYNAKFVTKPKSKAYVDLTIPLSEVIADKSDASEIIQSAIDSLKETGGTVLLPNGVIKVDKPLNVWAGIELRGRAEGAINSTAQCVINTDWGKDDENGEALITLHEGSGLRGFMIQYPSIAAESAKKKPKFSPYAYTVRGNGANIYIIDVNMRSSFNGVDFATNKCDNHYVQYIWGCPINIGIKVGGGSVGGIIRDVHYTPNCFPGDWQNIFNYIMANSRCFYVTDCTDEVLYHNFTYAGWRGIEINDGAKNTVVICHGTDCGNYSSYLDGNCDATFIDTQLVVLPGGKPDVRSYIYTDENFTGNVKYINTGMWGSPSKSIKLRGDGKITLMQGIVSNNSFISFDNGVANMYGFLVGAGTSTSDIIIKDTVKSCEIGGNLFVTGGKIKGPFTNLGNKRLR